MGIYILTKTMIKEGEQCNGSQDGSQKEASNCMKNCTSFLAWLDWSQPWSVKKRLSTLDVQYYILILLTGHGVESIWVFIFYLLCLQWFLGRRKSQCTKSWAYIGYGSSKNVWGGILHLPWLHERRKTNVLNAGEICCIYSSFIWPRRTNMIYNQHILVY